MNTWGWAGTASELLDAPPHAVIASLEDRHHSLTGQHPSSSQQSAWADSIQAMQQALRACAIADPSSLQWAVVFEYELPLQGGRRPDVVVLAGESIIVVEHKLSAEVRQPWIDQTTGYARDIIDYHEESAGARVFAVLLLGRAGDTAELRDHVVVCGPAAMANYLHEAAAGAQRDLGNWLRSDYCPLPSLVDAAKRIFAEEPLPHVRTALSAGIPAALDVLDALTRSAELEGRRILALVSGVPGAGKTLVGLRYVHEQHRGDAQAIFLSGNGPLVQVLQHALQSRVFVHDLHRFIKDFGIDQKQPRHNIVVFDEAQRAWDRDYMQHKKGVESSEPDLLINIGQRMDPWASLVGLVGTGQEIHSGEEGGVSQWGTAIRTEGDESWTIHAAPELAKEFQGLPVFPHDELDLDASLRSRRAESLHDWVALALTGSPALAARRAVEVQAAGFVLYLTRDLSEAKAYAQARYDGNSGARYGLLASSHDKSLRAHGVRNDFMATSRMSVAKWFNEDPSHEKSGCQLKQPVTEFQCQGLEVDLPIVCWGDDLLWDGAQWARRAVRRQYPLDDPDQILTNTYRVLMTRGRDGLVIWIPPTPVFDQTELMLLSCGVRPIPEPKSLGIAPALVGEASGEWGID